MKEVILGFNVDTFFYPHYTTVSRKWIACFNPHSYAVSLKDPEFEFALKSADWLVPDGSGIILASKINGGSIRNRITGYDVFTLIHTHLESIGRGRVFFLGSNETTLRKMVDRLKNEYPSIQVVGTYSPPYKSEFTEEESKLMIDAVNKCAVDVLWVGMTAPKQEKWILKHISALDVKLVGAVGAVFDFYAGNIKRSHPLFQKLGLEWLPRLLQEPKRLWRRTFISAPIFLSHVILAKFKMKSFDA